MLPRQILPGATYLVTRRCTQRQFLLAPSGKMRGRKRIEVNETFLYCLAYAAHKTGVRVHAAIVLSNHYHLVVTDPRALLPAFVAVLNRLVAKCFNCAYGRWENFWASEQTSYVRLADTAAVLDKIAYTLCNPVAAGLVETGASWPGVRLARFEMLVTRRPDVFFRAAGKMPDTLPLEISPPWLGEELSPEEVQARVDEAVARREQLERRRVRESGRGFLGARAILRQDASGHPRAYEARRKLSPQVACKNKWLRIETLERCKEFVRAYRLALAAWRAGVRDVHFPPGTYRMRGWPSVCCEHA